MVVLVTSSEGVTLNTKIYATIRLATLRRGRQTSLRRSSALRSSQPYPSWNRRALIIKRVTCPVNRNVTAVVQVNRSPLVHRGQVYKLHQKTCFSE